MYKYRKIFYISFSFSLLATARVSFCTLCMYYIAIQKNQALSSSNTYTPEEIPYFKEFGFLVFFHFHDAFLDCCPM